MNPRAVRTALLVLLALQVLVLFGMTAMAGPRMPVGTSVVLRATGLDRPDWKGAPQELWLDYGTDEIVLPAAVEPGDEVYVELLAGDSDDPARFGAAVADPADLPEDSTWITFHVDGFGDVETGPIQVFYDEDTGRVDSLRDHLDGGGAVEVAIDLDNDGDPTIDRVEAVD